eukprot:5825162-Pyramimonas_sp.AAC.1
MSPKDFRTSWASSLEDWMRFPWESIRMGKSVEPLGGAASESLKLAECLPLKPWVVGVRCGFTLQ